MSTGWTHVDVLSGCVAQNLNVIHWRAQLVDNLSPPTRISTTTNKNASKYVIDTGITALAAASPLFRKDIGMRIHGGDTSHHDDRRKYGSQLPCCYWYHICI